MRQHSTKDQMTQTSTTICNSTVFYNEQISYRIVKYKRHRNNKCKTMQMRNLTKNRTGNVRLDKCIHMHIRFIRILLWLFYLLS